MAYLLTAERTIISPKLFFSSLCFSQVAWPGLNSTPTMLNNETTARISKLSVIRNINMAAAMLANPEVHVNAEDTFCDANTLVLPIMSHC